MQPTHILFDYFGTLVEFSASDAGPSQSRAYAVLQSSGCRMSYSQFVVEWEESFRRFHARAQATLVEYALDDVCADLLDRALSHALDPSLGERFRDAYLADWRDSIRPIPGVKDLLADLSRDFVLALVSNTSYAPLVRGQLAQFELESHFAAIVTSVEHGWRKPSSSIFRHALTLTNGHAEEALHVGDSFEADYQGALAAGIPCLLIDPGRRHPVPVEHRIGSILDLPSRLGSCLALGMSPYGSPSERASIKARSC